MNKDLLAIFEYMEREKGIKREVIIAAIEDSLRAAALKSVVGISNVRVKVHPKTAEIEVYSEREIVEKAQDPAEEISLQAARLIDPDAQIGQVIDIVVTPRDFGRIAAKTARTVITQKLRSAERDVIYEEYRHRMGEIVTGTVKRLVRGINLIVDLGKVEAFLPAQHYPKTEHYQPGDKIQALLLGVEDLENGGAQVVLSRTDPEFVKQLLTQEVPELEEGIIVIEKIVREAGYRTKLLVRSNDLKLDPVGACVGVRGTRIKNAVRELNNEKIDIIPFNEDALIVLQKALEPVEIRRLQVNEERDPPHVLLVVDDEAYPIVLGKKGWNIRLIGQLIECELEVQRMSDYSRMMAVLQNELLDSAEPWLDEPLEIEGLNPLLRQNMQDAGITTPRLLLSRTPQELMEIPGINLEMAYTLLDQVCKKRT